MWAKSKRWVELERFLSQEDIVVRGKISFVARSARIRSVRFNQSTSIWHNNSWTVVTLYHLPCTARKKYRKNPNLNPKKSDPALVLWPLLFLQIWSKIGQKSRKLDRVDIPWLRPFWSCFFIDFSASSHCCNIAHNF